MTKIIENTYKIINFDKNIGQLLIQWDFDNSITPIDIPIVDNNYIIDEQLDIHIKGYFNVEYYNRLKSITLGINNEHIIDSLVV